MNRGAVLILTFIVMITLIAITVGFLYIVYAHTKHSGHDVASAKAFWIAEGGLQKYFLRLRDGTYDSGNIPTLNENLGDGSYSVTCSYDDSGEYPAYTISSTGTVDVIERKIEMELAETSAILARALHADGAHLKLGGSSGTIDGNVSCDVSVLPDPLPPALTITGTVTDGVDQDKVNPAIAMNTYKGLADALSQSYTVNITFTSAGSPYTGIWYTTKKAFIQSNVTINGSVVAEGTIEFEDAGNNNAENVLIDPVAYDASQNYPALVSDSNITGTVKSGVGLKDSTINGLVFANNNITLDRMDNVTFEATVIADNNIEMENGVLNITYDADVFSPMPPGFTFDAGSGLTVLFQRAWDEVAP